MENACAHSPSNNDMPRFIDHKDAAQSAFLLFENCRSKKVHFAAIAAVHHARLPKSEGASPKFRSICKKNSDSIEFSGQKNRSSFQQP